MLAACCLRVTLGGGKSFLRGKYPLKYPVLGVYRKWEIEYPTGEVALSTTM